MGTFLIVIACIFGFLVLFGGAGVMAVIRLGAMLFTLAALWSIFA